ncbi:MAG TPA: TetR/AcrR family transcriptional regulator [Stenomitos sp.]
MSSTRHRLIQAALELFMTQGVGATTTRKIAELAEVNEVTLFRQFGNKQGLLLAVVEESMAFDRLGAVLQDASSANNPEQVLQAYGEQCLAALEQVPGLVRAVIGESEEFSQEQRQGLGQKLAILNGAVAQYLAKAIAQTQGEAGLPPQRLASLLNGTIVGHAVLALISDLPEQQRSRDDFLHDLVQCLGVAPLPASPAQTEAAPVMLDLPAHLVHDVLGQAKRSSIQDYALAYVLFAAGLTPVDTVGLERSHVFSDAHQLVLNVGMRQVPVNQWILGKRYGSYTANPLVRWLKSRKDKNAAVFLNAAEQPMGVAEVEERWQAWLTGLNGWGGALPTVVQARQTWCIDMLLRGMSVENLSLLTGLDAVQLQPLANRAKALVAIAEATRLDRKPSSPI